MASGAATIIALLALIEAGVVFFCGEMGQLTPRGQSKAAEEAVVGRQGPCQSRQQGVQTAVQVRHVGSSWES